MNDWYEQRRFMVTGGAGFLGRSIVAQLEQRGAAAVHVPRSAHTDLRTREGVERALDEARPDVVIHAAGAVGGIAANAAEPGRFFYDNAAMGLEVIEGARRHGIEKLVVAGSVCAYPRDCEVPAREETLWDGPPEPTNAAYGMAKRTLLVQQQAYHAQYGTPSAHLLLANLYGPGDDFELATAHVVPALIRKSVEAVANDAPHIEVWGSGNASREFLYVDDAAEAVVLAAERLDVPDPVNVGSGAEVTIRDLAQTIARLAGFRGELRFDASRPDGQPRRALDTSRARERLGFEARTALEDGLQRTIVWYRERAGFGAPSAPSAPAAPATSTRRLWGVPRPPVARAS